MPRNSRNRNPLATPPVTSHLVCLGDKFALASGLMEITYDTGARVILQGPVTYEVESKDGGFLSLGKLTAKAGEGRRPKTERIEELSDSSSSFIVHRSSFAVRTPTAIVTDLGTEFGVEVDKQGHTTSHVFRGVVRVQMVAVDGKAQGAQVLRENESVQVDSSQGQPKIVVVPAAKSASFIREIPKQIIKTLDLVDVVAGGDGFSGRRGRGIDPTTGRMRHPTRQSRMVNVQGDYKYHRVEGMPFVDGVFIPEGSKGPVQIDSAGHVFPDCPKTDNWSYAYVWAGGKLPPIYRHEGFSHFGRHRLLLLRALAVVRACQQGNYVQLGCHSSGQPRLRGVAASGRGGKHGNRERKGDNVSADIWVLVDGQVRFKRREIKRLQWREHRRRPHSRQ